MIVAATRSYAGGCGIHPVGRGVLWGWVRALGLGACAGAGGVRWGWGCALGLGRALGLRLGVCVGLVGVVEDPVVEL
jgi:hypothetical protein